MRDTFLAFIALVVSLWFAPTMPVEIVIGITVMAVAFIAIEAFGEGEDWRRVHALLKIPPRALYHRLLRTILDDIDRRLNPEAVARGDHETRLSRAWGWRLYDGCLLLALLYPLAFVVVQWAIPAAQV